MNILSNCDSVSVLIWASAAGWLTSLVLVCGQGILTLPEAMETWMEGMKVTWADEINVYLARPRQQNDVFMAVGISRNFGMISRCSHRPAVERRV